MNKTWMLFAALAACSSGIGKAPADTAVKPSDATRVGPYGYQHSSLRLDVGDRGGGLPSTIDTLLMEPLHIDDTPAPFAILIPEEGTQKEWYAYTGFHLASWGFNVIIPQIATLSNARTDAEQAADVLRIIDAIGKGAVQTKVTSDPSTVALAGHGRGGRIALIAARQQAKPSAVFLLSPHDGDGKTDGTSVMPEEAAGLVFPIGVYGAGRALQVAPGQTAACAPRPQSYKAIYPDLRGDTVLVEVTDGGHGDVLDVCLGGAAAQMCDTTCVAGADPDNAINVARGAMAAFLGAHLRHDAGLAQFFDASFMIGLVPGVRVSQRDAGQIDTGGSADTSLP